MFLAVSARWDGIGGQGAVSARELDLAQRPVLRGGGCAGGNLRQGYRSKTELALEMVGRAQERGHLKAGMGRGGRRLRDVAVLPGGPGGLGDVVRAGRSVRLYGVPKAAGPAWTSAEYQGFGRPRKPRLRDGQRRTMEQRSDESAGGGLA